MGREWKPGDVVMIDADYSRFDGQLGVVVEEEGGTWAVIVPTHDPEPMAFGAKTLRPLAVIDPENPEDVERLYRLYYGGGTPEDQPVQHLISQLTDALREFATPTPPKPEEPQGLGAVVEDTEGRLWTLPGGPISGDVVWYSPDLNTRAAWAHIAAVRVLSEGWSE